MASKKQQYIEVQAYESKYGVKVYEIIHLPTNSLIADSYYFMSTARVIAKSIIEEIGDSLSESDIDKFRLKFNIALITYIHVHQRNPIKKPSSFTDWLTSPEWAEICKQGSQPSQAESVLKDAGITSESFKTLGWVSSDEGTIGERDLRNTIGRIGSYCERIHLIYEK